MKSVTIQPGQVLDLIKGEARPLRSDDVVEAHICRRLEDFPRERIPPAAVSAECTVCYETVLFNPAAPVCAPKVCMQCAGIAPAPFPRSL